MILLALGVDSQGTKHVLGPARGHDGERDGVQEPCSPICAQRGLDLDRPMLFIIDGGTGLRKAIRETVRRARRSSSAARSTRRATSWSICPRRCGRASAARSTKPTALADAALAKRRLAQLAAGLERTHPGAAASLREGLDETLTLQRLGVTGALYRTLRSTNAIENLNGLVGHFVRNVRRWRDGRMLVRWIAAGLHEARRSFRRVRGHADLAALIRALDRRTLDTKKEVA